MSVLSDKSIRDLAHHEGLISPFEERLSQVGVISYGLSSFGYDVRLGTSFRLWQRWHDEPLDPLNIDPARDSILFERHKPFPLEPGGFILAHTVEYLRIPENVTAYVKDKSTYARCGICVQNTVLEAGWEGQVTLEIYNYLPRPVLLRPGQGIAQVVFHYGWEACETSYAHRQGKYQGQTGVTLPRVKAVAA